jgi:predicted 2-oxoglutarate/Fe(II)-dependent dioxygenase YbiX
MNDSQVIWLTADMTEDTVRAILMDVDCSIQPSDSQESIK